MKIYRVSVLVIDFDELGATVLEVRTTDCSARTKR